VPGNFILPEQIARPLFTGENALQLQLEFRLSARGIDNSLVSESIVLQIQRVPECQSVGKPIPSGSDIAWSDQCATNATHRTTSLFPARRELGLTRTVRDDKYH